MMKLKLNEQILLTLLTVSDSDFTIIVEGCWQKFKHEFEKSIKTNGKREALKRYKECHMWYRDRLLMLNPNPLSFCKSDRKGVPKPLWSLRPIMNRRSHDYSRLILSITSIYLTIHLPVDYDTSQIEDKPSVFMTDESILEFGSYVTDWISKIKRYVNLKTETSKCNSTMKAGPNGHALVTSHYDVTALFNSGGLLNHIQEINEQLNNSWILEMMENNYYEEIKDSPLHSKLSFTSQPGGKTRIFAIGDYWSQMTLKPIHDCIYTILSRLTTDGTFNQDKAFKRVLTESKGKETFCYDLKAATDRAPVFLQEIIISELFGGTIGHHWCQLMTNRDFYIKATKRNVRWNVGQPLGLLSSWGAFTLWHHIVVQYCANSVGMKTFRDYAILGDDIVIWDKSVAIKYLDFMKSIDVKINLTKSIIGCSLHSQIEFAKRIAIDGEEISGIPYTLLNKNHIKHVMELVLEVQKRSMIAKDNQFPFIALTKNRRSGCSNQTRTKREEIVNLLVWHTLAVSAENKFRLLTSPIDPDEFNNKVKQMRAARLVQKATKAEVLRKDSSYLSKMFQSHKAYYDSSTLNSLHLHSISQHPLQVVISEKDDLFQRVYNDIFEADEVTISEIEYLPTVPYESYFYNSKSSSLEFYSTVIVDTFYADKIPTIDDIYASFFVRGGTSERP